ncbi:MAG: NrsF family protein [Betaproteobacteria bacterium]
MKTEDLIQLLSRGAGPAPRVVAARRLGPGAALGLLAAAGLAALVPGWVPLARFGEAGPWFTRAYAGALARAAGGLAARLGRPVPRAGPPLAAVAAVLVAALGVGLGSWWQMPAAERTAALMGHSALQCPWNVLGLSLPALAVALWALRGLAPTRPVAAGAAAGLLAGALGAMGYALACAELALPFVAAWYTVGVLMAAALGALLGPRLLRW